MNNTEIHAKLVALDQQLSKVEGQLLSKAEANSAHLVTNQELRDRHIALTAQVAQEEAGETKIGHHVSALEHSVRIWMDRLSTDMK